MTTSKYEKNYPCSLAGPMTPNSEVAARAYVKWLNKGRPFDTHLQDWLEAEAEVKQATPGAPAVAGAAPGSPQAMKNYEALYHALVESLPINILCKDREGRFTFANGRFCATLGRPLEEILGKSDQDFYPLALAAKYRHDDVEVMTQGKVFETVEEHVTPAGDKLFVQVIKTPLFDPPGTVAGVQGIFWDVTEKKRIERRVAAEHAVTRVLAESATLKAAAAGILQAVCDGLEWDAGAIWRVDRRARVLRCVEVWLTPKVKVTEFAEACRTAHFAEGTGLLGRVWAGGEPVWVPDITEETGFPRAAVAVKEGLHGAVGFPIRSGGRFVGAIEFYSRQIREPDQHLLNMMASIGSQIGQFIARCRTERSLRIRTEESAVARRIQQGLLPREMPVLPGFDLWAASHPAREAGGDYYDFLPLPDGGLGIVVGDASGHGVGPALLTAETRAYLRALALTHSNFDGILSLVNRRLADDVTDSYFVTLFFARLDPQTRSFDYASAGHPTGYVLDREGQVKALLTSTGLPLGIHVDGEFPIAPSTRLEPGEIVLLLTDGVVDTRSADGDFFGYDRALEVVRATRARPARAIVDALYRAVRNFGEGLPRQDDITLAVIKAEA